MKHVLIKVSNESEKIKPIKKITDKCLKKIQKCLAKKKNSLVVVNWKLYFELKPSIDVDHLAVVDESYNFNEDVWQYSCFSFVDFLNYDHVLYLGTKDFLSHTQVTYDEKKSGSYHLVKIV